MAHEPRSFPSQGAHDQSLAAREMWERRAAQQPLPRKPELPYPDIGAILSGLVTPGGFGRKDRLPGPSSPEPYATEVYQRQIPNHLRDYYFPGEMEMQREVARGQSMQGRAPDMNMIMEMLRLLVGGGGR